MCLHCAQTEEDSERSSCTYVAFIAGVGSKAIWSAGLEGVSASEDAEERDCVWMKPQALPLTGCIIDCISGVE